MKLPAFLAGFVDPILKDDGYDRAGATYFRGHPSGDQEIVWFQKLSSSYRSVVSFRPIASIDPQLARDVIVSEARRETAGPQTKIGLWSRKMYSTVPGQFGDWSYDTGDDASIQLAGELVAQSIRQEAQPLLNLLSSPARFEAELRSCGDCWRLPGELALGDPNDWPLAMVIAGQRQDPEVDAIMLASIGRRAAGSRPFGWGFLPSLVERLSSGDYPHRSTVLQAAFDAVSGEGR